MERAGTVWLAAAVSGLTTLLLALPGGAAPIEYLFRGERVCAESGDFCLSGSLSYEGNSRLLRLRARVQKAPGPGLLRISLAGRNRQGFLHTAPMEIRLRGNYSEIIDFKMIPDYPDTLAWGIERVEFMADSAR
jgi:hypothetical protein